MAADYDPLATGSHPVGVRTVDLHDAARGRMFPVEIWYPARDGAGLTDDAAAGEHRDAAAEPGEHLLVVFSHHSFGGRRSATFLSRHLASHGYVVAALDHSELVAPELGPRAGETAAERAERIDALIGTRVPDVSALLSFLLEHAASELADIWLAGDRVGIAGHSFGGWTALAAPDTESLIGAVVALAPGGGVPPVPGVLPLTLSFQWRQSAPVLVLTGDCDVPAPLDRVQDVFARAPAPKRMFVLRRADHEHFTDDVETSHEAARAMKLPGEAAWMSAAVLPPVICAQASTAMSSPEAWPSRIWMRYCAATRRRRTSSLTGRSRRSLRGASMPMSTADDRVWRTLKPPALISDGGPLS